MAPRLLGVFRDFGGAGEGAQGGGWAQTPHPHPPPHPSLAVGLAALEVCLSECPGQSQEVQC